MIKSYFKTAQKVFKKSKAFKTGIFRKGCSTNKSLSPVMIHDAFEKTASSRNLLSFGSRQAFIDMFGTNISQCVSISSITLNRSSSFTKYESNFLRKITFTSSSKVSCEIANIPLSKALIRAFFAVEFRRSAALIKLFVSKTKKSVILVQNILKDFLGKAAVLHSFSQTINKLFKFLLGILHQLFRQFNIYFLGNPISFFFGSQPPFFCGSIIHCNYNSFHNQKITVVKIQKINEGWFINDKDLWPKNFRSENLTETTINH